MGVALADAPSDFDLRIASDALDAMGPFKGSPGSVDQERAFPRILQGSQPVTPDAVLDAVCLLAKSEAEDEDPAIQSESTLDKSITYASPKIPISTRRIGVLMAPYLLRVGSRA